MALKPYYDNNGITLYHGDCRKILPELQSETFDMVLTDPPYLVSYSGRWGNEWEPIVGDSDPTWVLPVYTNLFRVLRPDSMCLGDSEACRSAFRSDVDHDSEVMPISVPN